MDIAKNIHEIRSEKGLNQQIIADALGVDVAVASNIEKGKRGVKVSELEKISKALGVDMLYLLTYPDVYVNRNEIRQDPVEAILQIKLKADKKEQVLKLIFGDHNVEVLNK
jgi:transcriptional regulator with XRE-family HTH domain